MWPGVDPRVGAPLVVAGAACYGWLLAELHPTAARAWWAFAGVIALLGVALAVPRWRQNVRIVEVLAGRAPLDPEVAAQIDGLAGQVDFSGGLSVWTPPLAVFFIASTGLKAALERGDRLFWLPLAGIVLYAALAVALLRRRNRRVRRWLAERPAQPGWWSVPPT